MADTRLNTLPAHDLVTKVYESVGEASVCWESMSGTGVFQEDHARKVAEGLVDFIEANYERVTPVPVDDPDQEPLFDIDACE